MKRLIFACGFLLIAALAFGAITTDLSSNPIKVTGTASTAESVTTGTVHLTKIYWSQPTTQGHKLSITNDNGKQIIDVYCQTANQDIDINFSQPLIADGIKIDDMDSGTVYLYRR